MRNGLLGSLHSGRGTSKTAVFVIELSELELRDVEELRRCGGAFQFTVTSLQASLEAEPKCVSIERFAGTFANLIEEPVVAQI